MKTLSTEALERKIDGREKFALVNVLSRNDFESTQIPGAKNIPLETLNFATQVEQLTGDKDRTVVLYCASQECPASTNAATQLEAAGFTDVLVYKGGAKAWQESHGGLQAHAMGQRT